ncbi:3-isopropylmalate dehydratase small subunit [Poseidonocella sp. HB161398]|uniref:3-isopropylmalate dehydratase small subunit n=1 Tax=Poseidonocella sp. HB161398 TaxID=2320855 RepID=UPI0011090929|nr:3-isopropylmalate dehydratase small subunit [Poseidonocella sp. HB161398]
MEPFTRLGGIAAALPAANIDTDVIMPKQFLKGIDRSGLARGLFHDLRFDGAGRERPDFVLNRPETRGARFLVTGPNFGCGSSREHAVWGLAQYGIRALIGPSFAGIFFDNCARNGLLAIALPGAEALALAERVRAAPGLGIAVDLERQEIALPERTIRFEIEPARRRALLDGRDAIGQTLEQAEEIRRFERRHLAASPWLA